MTYRKSRSSDQWNEDKESLKESKDRGCLVGIGRAERFQFAPYL